MVYDAYQCVKTDNVVKFVQHAIQIMDDIITAILDVAGIQAYTQFVLKHIYCQPFQISGA